MKNQKRQPLEPDADREASVASYLATHVEFFDRNPELLLKLRLPHPSGKAVSLVERQIALLRDEADRYQQQLAEFISVARDNEHLNQRLHRLTLSLMDAGSLEETLTVLQDHLFDEFGADAVELKLLGHEEWAVSSKADAGRANAAQELLERDSPLCGNLQPVQLDYLFGQQAAEIRSAALIPLRADGVQGLLAIGSRDANRFHARERTDFLNRLGEIVSRTLQVVSVPGA